MTQLTKKPAPAILTIGRKALYDAHQAVRGHILKKTPASLERLAHRETGRDLSARAIDLLRQLDDALGGARADLGQVVALRPKLRDLRKDVDVWCLSARRPKRRR